MGRPECLLALGGSGRGVSGLVHAPGPQAPGEGIRGWIRALPTHSALRAFNGPVAWKQSGYDRPFVRR